MISKNRKCTKNEHIFNLKKESNGINKICCNLPILNNDNIKDNCTINNDTTLCWHNEDPLECKINYIKILKTENKNIYFTTNKIPTIGNNPVKLIDILRNNIIMKNNITIKITKDVDDSNIDNIRNTNFWFLGEPKLIETSIKKYPLSSLDFKLFDNNIDIKMNKIHIQNSPSTDMSTLLYTRKQPIILENNNEEGTPYNFNFTVNFKHNVEIKEFLIYGGYYSSKVDSSDFKIKIINENGDNISQILTDLNRIDKLIDYNNKFSDWNTNKIKYKYNVLKNNKDGKFKISGKVFNL